MAATEFGTGSAQARKVWSEMLMKETFGKMGLKSLIGRGPSACIQMMTDLEEGAGDTIYFDLLAQDRSNGVNGDSKLDGFEAPLTYYQDTLKINQKRHAHTFLGMSQQRTVHDLRRDGRFSLSEWWAWFLEAGLFAHLAGATGTSNESVEGALGANTGETDFAGNTVTAPDAAHLLDTGAIMALSDIDDAVAMAKVNNPRVAPLKVNGADKYILYVHPYSTRSIRSGAGTTWSDIHQNASTRGNTNPIYSGALGEYNGVIIRESEFVPHDGTSAHNVLLGAGAGAIAFGNAWGKKTSKSGSYFNWKEKDADYDNEKGVAGISCPGFKGTQFNSQAFGRIVIQSDDPAPS